MRKAAELEPSIDRDAAAAEAEEWEDDGCEGFDFADCHAPPGGMNVPLGAGSIDELFGWHLEYAKKLLGTAEHPRLSNIARCCTFLSHDIEIHEQFSGVGTAGWTFHMASRGLRQYLLRLAGS